MFAAMAKEDDPKRDSTTRPPAMLRLARGLERLHLDGLAFRVYEWRTARGAGDLPTTGEDGLPLPPPGLQVLVSGGAGTGFVEDGHQAAETITTLLATNGTEISHCEAVLDFGIGCGRIARHWKNVPGPAWHGCDYNPKLVAWCDANLPFVAVAENSLDPPLPYPDDSFDLVYAYSVFTHLHEQLQFAWITELERVLKPGGLLLFSVHGDAATGGLDATELAHYRDGQLVERFSSSSGSNLCSVFHPDGWVRDELLCDFDVADVLCGGAPGLGIHDVYLARFQP